MLCVLLDFLEIKQIFLVMATPSHPAPHSDLFIKAVTKVDLLHRIELQKNTAKLE
jgi:hypothetical protein